MTIVIHDEQGRSLEGVTAPHPYLFLQVGDLVRPRNHKHYVRVKHRVFDSNDRESVDGIQLRISVEEIPVGELPWIHG
jgi:hypothetical protein